MDLVVEDVEIDENISEESNCFGSLLSDIYGRILTDRQRNIFRENKL